MTNLRPASLPRFRVIAWLPRHDCRDAICGSEGRLLPYVFHTLEAARGIPGWRCDYDEMVTYEVVDAVTGAPVNPPYFRSPRLDEELPF